MKTFYSLCVAVLCVATAFAQNPRLKAHTPAVEDIRPTTLTHVEYSHQKMEVSFTEEEGPTLFYDDFSSGLSGWDNEALPGYTTNAIWEYRGTTTTPDTGVGSRGAYAGGGFPIRSATRENGFVIFDSDYMDNGGTPGNFGMGTAPTPHAGALTSGFIDCSGEQNVLLSFHSYFRQYDAHGFVLVSTDNFATADTVYDASWYHAYNDAGPIDEVVKVNISASAGGSNAVKVRFLFMEQANWTLSGYYFWQIDDVRVQGGSDWDMSIEEVFYNGAGSDALHYQYASYYRTIPELQASATNLTMGVALRSLSQSPYTNAHLEATVSGASSFSGTSPNVDYTVFNTVDTVDLTTTFTPSAKGMHEVEFTVQGDSADDYSGDNTRTERYEVTDSRMGWCDGNVGGSVYWSNGDDYGVYTRFDIYTPDTVAGIQFGVHSDDGWESDHGAIVIAGIWKVTGGKLATSGDVDLENPEVSEFVTLDSADFTTYDDSNKLVTVTFEELFAIDTGEYVIGWQCQGGQVKTPMSNRPNGAVNAFISTDGVSLAGWVDYNPIMYLSFYNGDFCDENPVVLEGTITCNPAEWTADCHVSADNGDSTAAFVYAWSTGDATDDITVDAEGTYTVEVTDNNNCSETMVFSVFNGDINCNLSTGEIYSGALNIFPNPNDGQFQIQLNDVVETNLSLAVHDIKGAVVATYQFNGNQSQYTLDLGHLENGIYSAKLMSEDVVLDITKLVISH